MEQPVTKIMWFEGDDNHRHLLNVRFSSGSRFGNSHNTWTDSNRPFEDIWGVLASAFRRKYNIGMRLPNEFEFYVVQGEAPADSRVDCVIGEDTVDEKFKGGAWDPKSPNYIYRRKRTTIAGTSYNTMDQSLKKILKFKGADGVTRVLCVQFESLKKYNASKKSFIGGSSEGFQNIGEILGSAYLNKYGVYVGYEDNDVFARFVRNGNETDTVDCVIKNTDDDKDLYEGEVDD